jgi:hypothetical protein
MAIKLVSAVIAVVLLGAFLLPVALKLKETSLWVVMLLGFAMMLVDLWQSLRKNDT